MQSMKFIEAHHGNKKDISVYGQEYTNTTYKQAKMNLTIRGIACNLGEKAADTFHDWQCEGYECSEDRETQLGVRINQDTVWLNAYQIAELFGRDSNSECHKRRTCRRSGCRKFCDNHRTWCDRR